MNVVGQCWSSVRGGLITLLHVGHVGGLPVPFCPYICCNTALVLLVKSDIALSGNSLDQMFSKSNEPLLA